MSVSRDISCSSTQFQMIMAACPEDLQMAYKERSRDDKLEMAMSDFVLTLLFGRIENRLRNYPRFRNYDSETIWTDSETTTQKLFAPIQETTPIQKLRFRSYLDRLRNYDSETTCTDSTNCACSEIAIQKLFRPIQKLRFRNYFARFRKYDSETISTDLETISLP